MEARITETGALQVERAGVFKTQFCPYREKFCGDWCPSFEEEVPLDETGVVVVCGISFEIVEDLRKKEA